MTSIRERIALLFPEIKKKDEGRSIPSMGDGKVSQVLRSEVFMQRKVEIYVGSVSVCPTGKLVCVGERVPEEVKVFTTEVVEASVAIEMEVVKVDIIELPGDVKVGEDVDVKVKMVPGVVLGVIDVKMVPGVVTECNWSGRPPDVQKRTEFVRQGVG